MQVIPFLISFYPDHVEEVRAIIQRAAKDIAIESSLKTYEEVWLSKIFELKAHVRMKGPSSATAATHDVSMFLFSCCLLGFCCFSYRTFRKEWLCLFVLSCWER